MHSQLRVHVATIDHHIERITEPMISLRADRAHIITYGRNDSAKGFLKRAKGVLKKHGIQAFVSYADIWNLMECVEKFRSIVEQETGNQVFFNVSAGTKVSCISAMLACMIWDCKPYYARPRYKDMKISKKVTSEKIEEIVAIPTYKMLAPKTEHVGVLSALRKNAGRMKKKQLIEHLKEQKMILPAGGHGLSKPAEHGQLRTILDPMIKSGQVTVEPVGRSSVVRITTQGENTLSIFGEAE